MSINFSVSIAVNVRAPRGIFNISQSIVKTNVHLLLVCPSCRLVKQLVRVNGDSDRFIL